MIASSALPAPSRGSSGGEDASGFRGILDAQISADGGIPPKAAEGGSGPQVLPGAADPKAAEPQVLPGVAPAKDAARLVLPGEAEPGAPEPQVLPGAVDTKAPDPEVLPSASPAKGGAPLVLPGAVDDEAPEPQVLPGGVDAKAPEPQVLPGTTPTKEAEPLVLPGAGDTKSPEPQVLPGNVDAKSPQPQVLPGAVDVKSPEPQVLPGLPADKGMEPQVLPGTAGGKPPQPQVLPGTPSLIDPRTIPGGGESLEVASSGPVSEPARPGAGSGQTLLQPPSPPLKALAERTSGPLDESAAAAPSSPSGVKAAGPTTAPSTAPIDQAARPAQTVATPTAPQTDSAAPASDEGSSSGGPTAAQTEAAAPARDHSLSTLSRASIDATAQIAAQIQRRLEGRSTRFEIALRPAELGRVDVKLEIDAEGRLAARLAFDNPAAATDMRGRVEDLRRQLEAAGFHLAEDAIEFAERDSGSSAFDRGQDSRQGQNRAFAAAARLKSEIDLAQPPQWLALSLSPSGVDMKV